MLQRADQEMELLLSIMPFECQSVGIAAKLDPKQGGHLPSQGRAVSLSPGKPEIRSNIAAGFYG
jgi:hypothetical protein